MPASYLLQGATSNELIDYEVNGISALRDHGLQIMRMGDPGVTTEQSLIYALIDRMEPAPHAHKHVSVEDGIATELRQLIHQTEYIGTRGRIEAFANVYQYDVRVFDAQGLKWVILGFETNEDSIVITIVEHENGFFTSTFPLPEHLQELTKAQRRRLLGGKREEFDRDELEERAEVESRRTQSNIGDGNEVQVQWNDGYASQAHNAANSIGSPSQPSASNFASASTPAPSNLPGDQHSPTTQPSGGLIRKPDMTNEELQRKRQEAREKSKAHKMKQWLESKRNSQPAAQNPQSASSNAVSAGPTAENQLSIAQAPVVHLPIPYYQQPKQSGQGDEAQRQSDIDHTLSQPSNQPSAPNEQATPSKKPELTNQERKQERQARLEKSLADKRRQWLESKAKQAEQKDQFVID